MDERLKIWRKLARDLQEKDRALAPIIKEVGPPTPSFRGPAFRTLSESILSQQLAPAAATSIVKKFGALAPPFPQPDQILKWTPQYLRTAGVSPQKARYLMALSERWKDLRWRRGWEKLPNQELVDRLTEVMGIGEWTAHMFLIFSLGRPDVLAVGDYGIRRGMQILFKLKQLPKPRELPPLVRHWSGAESVASWYLWRGLDKKLLKRS